MPSFTAGKPPANEILATSQGFLKDNLDYLQQTGDVDHKYLNNTATTANGFHKVVRLFQQAQPGAAVTNSGQLYGNSVNALGGGVQLFYIDDSNNLTQLTNKARASNGASGWTALPGGMLMQWGVATGSTGSAISFTNSNGKPFTAVYSVQVTVFENNDNRHFVQVKSVSVGTPGSFTIASRDSGGNDEANTFYWLAIGSMV